MKEEQEKLIEDLKDEEINLLEYIYTEGETVTIPGKLVEGLITLLRQVENNETNQGFISSYPKDQKVKKTKEGAVEVVEIDWELYPTANAYFSQQPQETKTMLGVMSLDLLMLLQQIHLENIRLGKAKKIGSIQTPEKDADISIA